MAAFQFHDTGARRIAYRYAEGRGPAIVFLPGYMSDMSGSKATALFEWAQGAGRACLLLDYSGCGRSEGIFAEGWGVPVTLDGHIVKTSDAIA